MDRRRGRYFHLESPARPPHTHMYTRRARKYAAGRERADVRTTGREREGREGGGEVTEVIARRGTSVPRNCSWAFLTEPPTHQGGERGDGGNSGGAGRAESEGDGRRMEKERDEGEKRRARASIEKVGETLTNGDRGSQ